MYYLLAILFMVIYLNLQEIYKFKFHTSSTERAELESEFFRQTRLCALSSDTLL